MGLTVFSWDFVFVSHRPPNFTSDDHLLGVIAGNAMRGLVRSRFGMVIDQHPRCVTPGNGGIAMSVVQRLLVRAVELRKRREGVSDP